MSTPHPSTSRRTSPSDSGSTDHDLEEIRSIASTAAGHEEEMDKGLTDQVRQQLLIKNAEVCRNLLLMIQDAVARGEKLTMTISDEKIRSNVKDTLLQEANDLKENVGNIQVDNAKEIVRPNVNLPELGTRIAITFRLLVEKIERLADLKLK
ncbi:hypothetical protein [Pteromalus puparum negative-strand RNA virus 1]|uniref:Uncharacterized protein n=1 Tax=Pteromalus puparum negative-strand RNA virus 1 TaxID=1926633 RepID=A0A1L5BWP3_9MONO|nr:hypothetical protein [Pteromalus puparum negative-strand RNA virus 1]APL97664.1 hypothetical protein [Pteromalus puparum negative-strand RNA virus 1]